MDKNELIIVALQQRIGEITASYEAKIASLRADITLMTQAKEKKETE